MSADALRPPSLDEIERIAAAAFDALPAPFRQAAGNVVIQVMEFPDRETMREMGTDDPFSLLGLYHGVALTEKSVVDPSPGIDMIYLYRRALLDYWCETAEDFVHLVRHVLIHEIGHHLGLSDAEMARIEADGAAED